MRVCLYLDSARTFRWHLWLAEALGDLPDTQVSLNFSGARRALPKMCTLLFNFERLIYGPNIAGNSGENAIGKINPTSIMASAAGSAPFDVVIDFAADGTGVPTCNRVLTPCFNMIPGEIGAISALMSDEPLVLALHDSARPLTPWIASPATENRGILLHSLDNILSCMNKMITKVVHSPILNSSLTTPIPNARRNPTVAIGAATYVASAISHKAARYLTILLKGHNNWSVAWRLDPKHTLLDNTQPATFDILPDDRQRYYADPFPFRHQNEYFIFVEEFPFATGRGGISVSKIENGRASMPRMIIGESSHLSYPFVFEHNGDVWMIPESGAAGGIYLYRAEAFPYKWRREICLIDGIKGYDATLHRHDGRFWLFVCEKFWKSSSWDSLSLFYADRLTGPWLPHSENPVLFDASLSRPAGALFKHNDHTVRPIQDCSLMYGGAIVLCRIDTLNPNTFAQTMIGTINCASRGCHTYNNHGGLQVVDLFGRQYGLANITPTFTAT